MANLVEAKLLNDTSVTIPFPANHDSVKEMKYSKTISAFYMKPYGVVRIFFKSKES